MMLKTERLGSEDDNGDLTAQEWRCHWRLGAWEIQTTLKT